MSTPQERREDEAAATLGEYVDKWLPFELDQMRRDRKQTDAALEAIMYDGDTLDMLWWRLLNASSTEDRLQLQRDAEKLFDQAMDATARKNLVTDAAENGER